MYLYQPVLAVVLAGLVAAAPASNQTSPSVAEARLSLQTKLKPYTTTVVSKFATTDVRYVTKTIDGSVTVTGHTKVKSEPTTLTIVRTSTIVHTKKISSTKKHFTKTTESKPVTSKVTKSRSTSATTTSKAIKSTKSKSISSTSTSKVSKSTKSKTTLVTSTTSSKSKITRTQSSTSSSSTGPSATDAPLPVNLDTQYGGIDLRAAQGKGMKPGLFDFNKGGAAHTYTLGSGPLPSSMADIKQKRAGSVVRVPGFMYLDNVGGMDYVEAYGDSRQEYQSSMSQQLGMTAGIFGFSGEVQDSFSETSNVETYQKYASSYTMAQHYTITLNSEDDASINRQFLSDEAVALFQNGTPAQIVQRFGTHFMTSATFGGSKRYASRVDIRDSSIATDFSEALSISIKVEDPEIGNPSAGTTTSNSNSNVQKLYTLLGGTTVNCLGGYPACGTTTASSGTDDWLLSIASNPAIIRQRVASLDMLMLASDGMSTDGAQTRQQALASYIASIMASMELQTARALVIYKGMSYASDDVGSDAHTNIRLNYVNTDDGWYSLGQYAQGSGYGGISGTFHDSPDQYLGIQIQETNSVPAGSVLQRPSGFHRTWGNSDGYGTFELDPPSGFASLGSIFKRDDDAQLQDFGSMVLLNTSILVPAQYTASNLWNDQGSGSNDDGSIWGVAIDASLQNTPPYGPMQKTPNQDATPSYLFHSTGGYDQPGITAYQLDFTQVKVVSDFFLASVAV